MKEAKNYMVKLKNATGTKLIDLSSIYSSEEGHLRFARETGAGLPGFSEEGQKYILDNSYNLYVTLTSLRPLLSSKEWLEAINTGKEKTLDYKNYTGEKLYNEIELLSEVGNIYWKVKLDFQDLKLTKEETIEMYDEIIRDYNIKNIIDFRKEIEKIEAEFPQDDYYKCQ